MEAAATDRRGVVLSWQGASQSLAVLVGGLVATVLTAVLSPHALDAYGWRIAFLLGAAAVPFGLWLRGNLPETLHSADPGPTRSLVAQSMLAQAKSHWRIIVLGLVVLASGTISSYIFTYTVTFAQATLHMSARSGFVAGIGINVIGIPAALLGGWMSDRYGRWPINVWGNLLFLVMIYPAFAWIVATRSELVLIAAMTALSAAANFKAGSFRASLAESLPKTIRGSGYGTVYAVSFAAFGGTTQLVVTWLIHVTGSAIAPAWYLIGATFLAQVACMLLRESAPRRQLANRRD